MAYLVTSLITQINERITKKQTQLAAADLALDAAITEIESYKFDSGEGNHSTKYRKIEELQKLINQLEKQIESLQRRLAGTGIVNINLRRKH